MLVAIPVPYAVVKRDRNLRIIRVASQSDAAKFTDTAKKAGFNAQFKLGKSKQNWYVRIWK